MTKPSGGRNRDQVPTLKTFFTLNSDETKIYPADKC